MKKDKLKTKMLFLSEISPILRVWKPLLFCGPFERGLMRRPRNVPTNRHQKEHEFQNGTCAFLLYRLIYAL